MSPLPPHAGQRLVHQGAPVGKGRGVVVMVHGRNAAPENILDLVPRLDRPDFSYLAPAAADCAWYPLSFLADIPKNEPGLSSALSVLAALVDDLAARGVPRERVVLMGFSQGACLTSEFAVRNASRFGGVVVFSGGLIGPPGTVWNNPGSFEGTPIFMGCSDVDSHVPKERVEESAAVFTRMGAAVTAKIYSGMGHLVIDDEVTHAQAILDSL